MTPYPNVKETPPRRGARQCRLARHLHRRRALFASLSSSVFLSGLHRRLLYPVALLYALELVLCGDLSGQL